MKLYLATAALLLFGSALQTPAQAQRVDAETAIDQLMQWTMEDIARQRTRGREADAAEEAQRKLPDLSQYGTPVESSPRRSTRAPPSNDMHCRTINLGDGDSATHCFSN